MEPNPQKEHSPTSAEGANLNNSATKSLPIPPTTSLVSVPSLIPSSNGSNIMTAAGANGSTPSPVIPPATAPSHPLMSSTTSTIQNEPSPATQPSIQPHPTSTMIAPAIPSTTAASTAATAALLASAPPTSAGMDFATGSTQYRPLNVKDALSYLDQVKNQFGDQPDVYNRFLDIMKEFKSQSIDTPGVINRVSTLFRGHPNLITGFNTFLPPGYRIEATNDPLNPIRVTTPPDSEALMYGMMPHASSTSSTTAVPSSGAPTTYYTPSSAPATAWGAYATIPNNSNSSVVPPPPPPQPVQVVAAPPSVAPPAQSHPLPAIAPAHPPPRNLLGISGATAITIPAPPIGANVPGRAPMEFNHAITYVNKIMNRFAGERETYKQFLEILQTYQKEQKPIQEVYQQIAILFKDHKDLLDEFKLFLPETVPNNRNAQAANG
ncbi:hypothetical protein SmJEL517_g02267 [Synchytrium microbalum]|uniref:Histone deacetylase interacting domain-containing protein n=1 Tax=Synchytrium microbalum TaxID=1806994 RepID=A0A507C2J4_9FUNG|nr:uncharacterized protein SmJEL517_g02267 [Synchytrium microbalum]TPX35347.1 hypothetical protein SmJEL517_g02267 [Synchytrium microbalum]